MLVCAYACHSTRGTEDAVGSNRVQAMSTFRDVTVIGGLWVLCHCCLDTYRARHRRTQTQAE